MAKTTFSYSLFYIFIFVALIFLLEDNPNFVYGMDIRVENSMGIDVTLSIQKEKVLVDNGIVGLQFTNPGGVLIGVRYNGVDNLLELGNDGNGGFWDLHWGNINDQINDQIIVDVDDTKVDRLISTRLEVTVETKEQVELSFSRTWNISQQGKNIAPLNVDKRFVLLRGSSGFYSYSIYEHTNEMPSFALFETRIVFFPNANKFHYMSVSDNIQRFMPSRVDRLPSRGKVLDYKEAVLLVNPLENEFKGEVDDKYFYKIHNNDNRVHGWISQDPGMGFWQITPSNEFRTGGPFKQDLTSHVGPTNLAMFVSLHLAGNDLAVKLRNGEEWKKVFGPVFIYLNSVKPGAKPSSLWDDAKIKMKSEVQSWPYTFPASIDFPKSNNRGKVNGRLLVKDKYVSNATIVARGAYVGLAAEGGAGSWQRESKGYQFWARVNRDGSFVIDNVREGNYNLFATVPGFVGDYKHKFGLRITAGGNLVVGNVVYEPPRNGPTLWEIGYPDRSAAEFYIPDPNPKYKTKITVDNTDKFRQYGLWERHTDLYPKGDLTYTIGVSDYKKDWFFAQVTRKTSNNSYIGTTWQIKFKLAKVVKTTENYTLRLALASTHLATLEVRVNKKNESPLLTTGRIGGDNAIARHGVRGIYWLFSVSIPPRMLIKGENIIFLSQIEVGGPFKGIMYDYIRLEGPKP